MNIDKYMEKRYGSDWKSAKCKDCQHLLDGECNSTPDNMVCSEYVPNKSLRVIVCSRGGVCPDKLLDCEHCQYGEEVKEE